jgi:hypothetical protein
MEETRVNKFTCSSGHETECDVPMEVAEILHLPCGTCSEFVKLIPDAPSASLVELVRQDFTNRFIPTLIKQSFELADKNYWRGFCLGAILGCGICIICTILTVAYFE